MNNSTWRIITVAYTKEDTWFLLTMLSISAVSFISSMLVLLLVARRRRALIQKENTFLISLQVTHLFVGFTGTVCFSLQILCCKGDADTEKDFNMYKRHIFVIQNCVYILSITMAILVTIEKFLSIRFAFWFSRRSSCFYKTMLFSGFIPPLLFLVSSSLLISASFACFILVVTSVTFTLLVIFTNVFAYNEVHRHLKDICRTIVVDCEIERRKMLRSLRYKKMKAAGVCSVIVLSTIFFLLPFEIVSVMACQQHDDGRNAFWEQHTTGFKIANVFLLVGLVKDPLMYIMLKRNVRKEVFKVQIDSSRPRCKTVSSFL